MALQAFEVKAIADMQQEIFGPVLHVVRWSGDPVAGIDQIGAVVVVQPFGADRQYDVSV